MKTEHWKEAFGQFFLVCQGGQLEKMVADIVARLPGFFNGSAEIVIACLLERKKMVFLLKPGIFVQALGLEKKHGVKKEQNQQKHRLMTKYPWSTRPVYRVLLYFGTINRFRPIKIRGSIQKMYQVCAKFSSMTRVRAA